MSGHLKLFAGLNPHQVLQRNAKNVNETVLVGETDTAGDLLVTVKAKNKVLPGWRDKKVAKVKAGRFECLLTGIAVGGPYDIFLRVGDGKEVAVKDILVGDVWILGGQSNMQGCGDLKTACKPHPRVRAFYMNDKWAVAKDPIHNLWDAVDPVHAGCLQGPGVGAGPGVPFAVKMHALSGVPQGLLSCGHGGTTMTQWSPQLKDRSGTTLYSATLRRFYKNGQRVAGVVWYQGCSETGPKDAAVYTQRMIELVAAFRKDLKNPQLPFIAVQIATFFSAESLYPDNFAIMTRGWNSIREQQRLLPKKIKNLAVVPAIDLPLNDPIHLNGTGQNILGVRLAQAAWTLAGGKKAAKPPITLKSIKHSWDVTIVKVEAEFDNVIGSLQAPHMANGFTLAASADTPATIIYRTELQGSKAILYTGLDQNLAGEVQLYYGFSPAAYCNITDEGGRSLPAFGPVAIAEPKAVWKVQQVRRTPLLPGAGKLHSVKCPNHTLASLKWREQKFASSFLDLHEEIEPHKEDLMVFYHLPFHCEEPMKLLIGLGYDGPVKAWLDGKQIYFDPKGFNPMVYDQGKVRFNAKAGKHHLIIALSTNNGLAWGVGLRVYRRDIAKALVLKGPEFYKLPKTLR